MDDEDINRSSHNSGLTSKKHSDQDGDQEASLSQEHEGLNFGADDSENMDNMDEEKENLDDQEESLVNQSEKSESMSYGMDNRLDGGSEIYGNQMDGSEDLSRDDDEDMDDSNFDEEEYKEEEKELDENIPERKVRYRILKFINKLRSEFKLGEFFEDYLGNQVAMDYARYLLTEKENETELQKM